MPNFRVTRASYEVGISLLSLFDKHASDGSILPLKPRVNVFPKPRQWPHEKDMFFKKFFDTCNEKRFSQGITTRIFGIKI